jgi:uncharacterized protein
MVADGGRFGQWVVDMLDGMRSGAGSDVPCGGCVACCTSGQTILVDAGERDRLPAASVVALRDGEQALALDADGRCVLLVDGACTAYDVRPMRCRTYDCRIFPATGLSPEPDKPAIALRAAEWTFRYEDADDHRRRDAVRTAVVAIRSQQVGGRPTSTTQLAAAALLAHEELL